MPPEKREKLIEWISRTLLTVHVWFVASGYITFLQTKRQLISPLIPRDLILQVSQPGFYTSSVLSGSFLISLWLYFFRRRFLVIIVSGLSIIMYEFILTWFF
jgi:hypothetical protein